MTETQGKPVVVVLGMHRSGTSLCMNMLRPLGVRVDSDLPSDIYNELGYFESREILHINEAILRAIGLCWHSLLPDRMSDDWVDDETLRPFKLQLASLIAERTGRRGHWGVKDPRICLLLPLYEQIFQASGLEPLYVICIRNPAAIARSLERRNQMPRALSELLWMDHTLRAIRLAGDRLRAVVHYEDWFPNPAEQFQRLRMGLNLRFAGAQALLPGELDSIAVPELDHSNGAAYDYAIGASKTVYGFLREGRYDAAEKEFAAIQRALRMGISAALNTCQLFWRTKKDVWFNETNSSRAHTDLAPLRRVVARLSIPPQADALTGLRLDPADNHGFAHLRSIRICSSDGAPVWAWDGDPSLAQRWQVANMTLQPHPERAGVLAYFHKCDPVDPNLIIPVAEEHLGAVSKIGGYLELEFAWQKDGEFARSADHNVIRMAQPALVSRGA